MVTVPTPDENMVTVSTPAENEAVENMVTVPTPDENMVTVSTPAENEAVEKLVTVPAPAEDVAVLVFRKNHLHPQNLYQNHRSRVKSSSTPLVLRFCFINSN
uniref:Uncharacterized protein n=1 Tax=Populus alba TaxID=43335 RepID=A0A4U5R178_POPAL|nr:hypothetical protein D5086_0000014440 [Populus alba]